MRRYMANSVTVQKYCTTDVKSLGETYSIDVPKIFEQTLSPKLLKFDCGLICITNTMTVMNLRTFGQNNFVS